MTVTTDSSSISTTPPLALTALEQDIALGVANLPDLEARRSRTLTLALDWKRHLNAAAGQRDDLGRINDGLRKEVESLRDSLRASRSDLDRFRTQVREKAIEVADAQGWCKKGLNEALDDLGLDRVETEWEVEVEITARQTMTVTVSAVDEDEARERVTDGYVDLDPDSYSWEWQTSDDLEIQSVEEA